MPGFVNNQLLTNFQECWGLHSGSAGMFCARLRGRKSCEPAKQLSGKHCPPHPCPRSRVWLCFPKQRDTETWDCLDWRDTFTIRASQSKREEGWKSKAPLLTWLCRLDQRRLFRLLFVVLLFLMLSPQGLRSRSCVSKEFCLPAWHGALHTEPRREPYDQVLLDAG